MIKKSATTKKLFFAFELPILVFALIAIEISIFLFFNWQPSLLILLVVTIVIFVSYELFAFKKYLIKPLAANATNVVEMKKIIADLNNSTKLLLQRDLELSRANEKLRGLDKMKSEFVSLATHQLRTPLSGVRWSLSMLLNGEMGELTPEQKVYIMKTYESNNRMITLINDMLQADRIDAGTIRFRFTPTNLLYLFENILAELKPLAAKRNLTLNFKADKDLPELLIDAENMRIVLQNLIDNAIKYSYEGGKVDIFVKKEAQEVKISVTDQGIGIPLLDQANIFNRFFRAPNALHTETDGSGLGLYIVKNIIDRHHGTINFQSQPNKGTTFYITLPLT